MASPLTSPPTFGEHQIEAVQRLLGFMEPESIKDYAKARDAMGKEELAYRLKAIKELPQEMLAMVIQAAQMRDLKRIMPPARIQAQPAEARSLKRPRPDTDSSETTILKPARQLELPYFAACCNKLHKCTELWHRESYFRNHFMKHLLSTSTIFKAQDGSNEWVCDPETCTKTFADAADFMAHIWEKHMRVVSRQQPGLSQAPVGASGYSPASYSVPHTPSDDPTFSPHPTAFSPPPSMPPNAMTSNATISHTFPFTTPAQTQLSVEAQSSVPFGMQPGVSFPGNEYPHVMHGNNNNMLRGMPHGNPPYGFNPHTIMPNNVTHSDVGQNMSRAFAHDDMTGWPGQSLSAPLSPNTAAGQPYPAHSNHDFKNFNADPRFG